MPEFLLHMNELARKMNLQAANLIDYHVMRLAYHAIYHISISLHVQLYRHTQKKHAYIQALHGLCFCWLLLLFLNLSGIGAGPTPEKMMRLPTSRDPFLGAHILKIIASWGIQG